MERKYRFLIHVFKKHNVQIAFLNKLIFSSKRPLKELDITLLKAKIFPLLTIFFTCCLCYNKQ